MREPGGVAEAVHLIHEPLPDGGGQHHLPQVVDVLVGPAPVLGGETVSAEERGDDAHGQLPAQPPRDAKTPELGLEVEAGSRLALHGGDAVGDQPGHPRGGGGVDLLVGGGARLPDEALHAAAGSDHVRPRAPLGEQLEVGEGIGVVHGMVVAVDEARGQQAAAQVVERPGEGGGGWPASADSGPTHAMRPSVGRRGAPLDQAEGRALDHRRHLPVSPEGIPHRAGLHALRRAG